MSIPPGLNGEMLTFFAADKREFIKISQAVGMGFLVMVCYHHILEHLRGVRIVVVQSG
jgi:hypothetical protein